MIGDIISFIVINFWLVILLYGLLRDTSTRSRLLRLLAVFALWKMLPTGCWFTFGSFIEDFGTAYPTWLIIVLVSIIPAYLYGFVSLLKENSSD